MNPDRKAPPLVAALAALCLAGTLPSSASAAAWKVLVAEPGRRIELDRDSVVVDAAAKKVTAIGRVVLDKPIFDHRTSASYRLIVVKNRFDCAERTYTTVGRSYYREEGALLREDDARGTFDVLVRSGTPDDRMLREVCRPQGASAGTAGATNLLDKVNGAAGGLRELNDQMVARAVSKDLRKAFLNARLAAALPPENAAAARRPAAVPSGAGTGSSRPAAAPKQASSGCGAGSRQSPIDVRDGIAVDLEPIRFAYGPAAFRVVDAGRLLQVDVFGGGFSLLGRDYELRSVHFHRPSETAVAGNTFAMEAQLLHEAADGRLAIVSVLLEEGAENPFVQAALNNLPLERGGEVAPPAQSIDLNQLLPESRGYYTFMGSLTAPPCSENVQWLVLRQPQQVSPGQTAIFARLYPANARPLQPAMGRIIKESR